MSCTRAGKYNQRVTIQTVTLPAGDGYGDQVRIDWQDVGPHWAEVHPLTGREFFDANQVKGQVSHRVRMRFDYLSRQINEADYRLTHKGKTLTIVSAVDVENRGVEVEILCLETK